MAIARLTKRTTADSLEGAAENLLTARPAGKTPSGATTTDTAASATPTTVTLGYWFGSLAVMVIAFFVGWGLHSHFKPTPFHPKVGISVFAVFYVVAQAIERALDFVGDLLDSKSVAKVIGGSKSKASNKRDKAVASGDAQQAADAQGVLDQLRANRTVVMFALASGLAFIACGYLGIQMLQAVGVQDPPVWLDLLVTGLAVGAGTKPLHDLIGNLQSKAAATADPPETGGSS